MQEPCHVGGEGQDGGHPQHVEEHKQDRTAEAELSS